MRPRAERGVKKTFHRTPALGHGALASMRSPRACLQRRLSRNSLALRGSALSLCWLERQSGLAVGLLGVHAVASWWLWSLRRLWVAVISRHSVRAAALPRLRNRVMWRLCLVLANTGSMICWRRL